MREEDYQCRVNDCGCSGFDNPFGDEGKPLKRKPSSTTTEADPRPVDRALEELLDGGFERAIIWASGPQGVCLTYEGIPPEDIANTLALIAGDTVRKLEQEGKLRRQ